MAKYLLEPRRQESFMYLWCCVLLHKFVISLLKFYWILWMMNKTLWINWNLISLFSAKINNEWLLGVRSEGVSQLLWCISRQNSHDRSPLRCWTWMRMIWNNPAVCLLCCGQIRRVTKTKTYQWIDLF